jgi:putative transcriptional regulator
VGSLVKFKKKLVSKVKELREKLNLPQQELARLADVSRQTIYYLEKGIYNPSITLSFKLSEIFNKKIEEIFYLEPVIKKLIENVTVGDLKQIANDIGIDYNRIMQLSEMTDEQLTQLFNIAELRKIAKVLGQDFGELFEED